MPGKKILVADDSLTIQKVIRLALSNEGYDIQAVSDGNDAIQQIAVFRPDVVLIDVSLPGKSAFEVKRATDAEPSSADLRFVLMSSAFERMDEQQIQQLQFHGRLTKPFDPAHLRKVLTDVLASVPDRMPAAFEEQIPSPSIELVPPPLPAFDSPSANDNAASDAFGALDFDELSPAAPSLSLDLPFELPPELPPIPTTPSFAPSFANAPPPLPSSKPARPAQDDSDIRHLTESTIRMSGLDDFEWSVKEPSLKPSSDIVDLSESNFPPFPSGSEPDSTLPGSGIPQPGIGPGIGPGLGQDMGVSEFEELHLDIPESQQRASNEVQGISQAAIEEMVRNEVQEALARMAQQILPEVAERVIKQEIHRLLSEQP